MLAFRNVENTAFANMLSCALSKACLLLVSLLALVHGGEPCLRDLL